MLTLFFAAFVAFWWFCMARPVLRFFIPKLQREAFRAWVMVTFVYPFRWTRKTPRA